MRLHVLVELLRVLANDFAYIMANMPHTNKLVKARVHTCVFLQSAAAALNRCVCSSI